MPFRFPLQAVLRLRQSVEQQQELRLRLANQQVSQMRQGIELVEASRHQRWEKQGRELEAGMTAAELHFALQCDAELQRYRGELEQQLGGMKRARDQQREIFQQARRMRETMEAIRDGQLRSYRQEALRREQRELDDLFRLRAQTSNHG